MKKATKIKSTIISKLEGKRQKLKEFGVKEIGLFGSYAKNKQKHGSDIDFIVTFNKINSNEYFNLLFYLENLFKRKIDLVVKGYLRPELNYVKQEAIYVRV